jgi:hypothetical protein
MFKRKIFYIFGALLMLIIVGFICFSPDKGGYAYLLLAVLVIETLLFSFFSKNRWFRKAMRSIGEKNFKEGNDIAYCRTDYGDFYPRNKEKRLEFFSEFYLQPIDEEADWTHRFAIVKESMEKQSGDILVEGEISSNRQIGWLHVLIPKKEVSKTLLEALRETVQKAISMDYSGLRYLKVETEEHEVYYAEVSSQGEPQRQILLKNGKTVTFDEHLAACKEELSEEEKENFEGQINFYQGWNFVENSEKETFITKEEFEKIWDSEHPKGD